MRIGHHSPVEHKTVKFSGKKQTCHLIIQTDQAIHGLLQEPLSADCSPALILILSTFSYMTFTLLLMLVYSFIMNNLKKALTRDDPRKYQKSKIEISGFRKNNQWDEVEWMMQKVSIHPYRKFKSAIRKIVSRRALKSSWRAALRMDSSEMLLSC